MRSLRFHHDAPQPPAGPPAAPPTGRWESSRDGSGRLNLLLSYSGWRDESWADRLPRLLEPMGVHSHRAASAREATRVIESTPVHIAVVDLGLPLDAPGSEEAGPRILELLARTTLRPPTVVIKRQRTARDDRRELSAALRAGAFAVIDRPHDTHELERMLDVLRRILARHYRDQWPGLSQS